MVRLPNHKHWHWQVMGGVTFLVIRLLTFWYLPTSAAATERNWSIRGSIHSKSRNRLNVERVDKLAYINHNLRLIKRKSKFNSNSTKEHTVGNASETAKENDGDSSPGDNSIDLMSDDE